MGTESPGTEKADGGGFHDGAEISGSRAIVSPLPAGYTYLEEIEMSPEQVGEIVPQMKQLNVTVSGAKYGYSGPGEAGVLYFMTADTKNGLVLKSFLTASEKLMTARGAPLEKENIDGTNVYRMVMAPGTASVSVSMRAGEEETNDRPETENEDRPRVGTDVRVSIWANGSNVFMTVSTIENESAVTEFIRCTKTL